MARIDNDKSAVTTQAQKPEPPKPEPAKQESKPETEQAAKPQPPPPKQEAKPAPKPAVVDAPGPKTEQKPTSTVPQSAKFPSGRKAKLPALGGTWAVRGDSTTDVADYVESGTHTSVVAEAFPGVSCTAQLARLQAKPYGRQAAKEQASAGQAWRMRLAGSDAPAIVACASTRTGSALVTLDVPDGTHPDLSELAWAMLGALAR
jgi:hypothetical protein